MNLGNISCCLGTLRRHNLAHRQPSHTESKASCCSCLLYSMQPGSRCRCCCNAGNSIQLPRTRTGIVICSGHCCAYTNRTWAAQSLVDSRRYAVHHHHIRCYPTFSRPREHLCQCEQHLSTHWDNPRSSWSIDIGDGSSGFPLNLSSCQRADCRAKKKEWVRNKRGEGGHEA